MIPRIKTTKAILPVMAFCLSLAIIVVAVAGCVGSSSEPTTISEKESVPTPTPAAEIGTTSETGPDPQPDPSAETTSKSEEKPVAETEETDGEAVAAEIEEVIYIDPPSQKAESGQEIDIDVKAKLIGHGISGIEMKLVFDPSVLQVAGVKAGDLLGEGSLIGKAEKDNQAGTLHYALARKGPTLATDHAGALATITFKVIGPVGDGTHNLTLETVKLTDENFNEISGFKVQSGSIMVVQ